MKKFITENSLLFDQSLYMDQCIRNLSFSAFLVGRGTLQRTKVTFGSFVGSVNLGCPLM